MLLPKRDRGNHNDHVELIQQDDQLSAVSPGKVEATTINAGGPPVIAVPEVSKVAARPIQSVLGYPRILGIVLHGPSLFYEFDFGLACVQVSYGHGYETYHAEMVKEGKLTSVLGDAYTRALREGVRWWNGSAWSAEPTKVLR